MLVRGYRVHGRVRAVQQLACGRGQEAKREPGGAGERVVAADRLDFRMQQVVLCGATPHVTVREARFANVGPAGAPLPVASVVMTPVWRSSMNSVRSAGGTMSPLSFGRSCIRSNSMYRPSTDSAGWSSSAAVLTPAGT